MHYSTQRLDVPVIFQQSVLCGFELHSSSILYATIKTIHSLVEILRIIKEYHLNGCCIIGFGFPKLKVIRFVIKVSVLHIYLIERY